MLTESVAAEAAISRKSRPRALFLLERDFFDLLYGGECHEAVAAHSDLLSIEPHLPTSDSWSDRFADAEIVFTGWGSPRFDAALLRRIPKLNTVFHAGGSVRSQVSEAFWQRGVRITSAASANAIPVAEFTVAAIVLALKRALPLSREVRRARTFGWKPDHAPGVRGATVGLISLGAIGREVLQRLRAFDLRVIAHDPHLSPARFTELGVESVSLSTLMANSEVVSLHTALTPETRGFITGELLRLLPEGATFINTARGELVRENELIEALRARPDLQAMLDVTSPEPPAADSPLYDLENVFLTPHIAGSCGRECRRLGWAMVEEMQRHLRGEALRHLVTREQAERQT